MKNRPTVGHYQDKELEHIDMQRVLLAPAELIGALKFQVFKYLYRFQSKGTPVKDLEKAQVYLRWLLEVVAEKRKDPSDMSAEEIIQEIEDTEKQKYDKKIDKEIEKEIGGGKMREEPSREELLAFVRIWTVGCADSTEEVYEGCKKCPSLKTCKRAKKQIEQIIKEYPYLKEK